MNVNKFGQVTVSADEAFHALYNGEVQDFSNLFLTDKEELVQFNQSLKANADQITSLPVLEEIADSLELFDEANRCTWFMPKEYLEFPIDQWLLDQCKTQIEKDRVEQELVLFIQHGMFDVLFYLKYLVDTMREHGIVWGVGRGSSVASYILYLLGVHKVDSIKYELDIHEFLKEK